MDGTGDATRVAWSHGRAFAMAYDEGSLVLRVVRPRWGLGPYRRRAALWTLDRDQVSTEEPAAGGLPNLRDGHLGFWGLEPTAVAARAGGVRGRRLARSIKAGR